MNSIECIIHRDITPLKKQPAIVDELIGAWFITSRTALHTSQLLKSLAFILTGGFYQTAVSPFTVELCRHVHISLLNMLALGQTPKHAMPGCFPPQHAALQ